MFEILLILSAGIFLFSLVYFDFDLLEPCVLVNSSLVFSIAIALSFADTWGYDVGIRATIYILVAMIAFTFGDIFAKKEFGAISIKHHFETGIRYEVSFWKILLALVAMGFMLNYNYNAIMDLAESLGYKYERHLVNDIFDGNILEMLKTIRWEMEKNKLQFIGRFVNYFTQISQTIAFICIYLFAFNSILARFKWRDLKLLIPPIFYLPFMILSTGRISMLAFFIYILTVVAIVYYRKHGFNSQSHLKLMLYVPLVGFLFVCMFLLMGLVTGKTLMGDRTPFMILAHYAGTSIPAFSMIVDRIQPEDLLIGSHTLAGIYRVIQKFVFGLPDVQFFLPFVHFQGIDTNVFTALGRYLLDYGFIGSVAIMWIFGFFYSFYYNRLKISGNVIAVVFYGYLSYPLLMFPMDDKIMLDFFSSTPFYEMFLLYVLSFVLIRTSRQ